MKFGGTSVGSADAISRTVDILATHAALGPVVGIVSAMSGVTNLLLAKADTGATGDNDGGYSARAELLAPHRTALLKLVAPGTRRRETEAELMTLADEAARLLYSVAVLRELSPRASDRIVTFGERMSSVLVAAVLNERGAPAQAVTADQLIVTDSVFGNAAPLLAKTREKASATLAPLFEAGILPVVTGFFGADERGIITTLGRGGSDYSGSILGHALCADEIWIWTDVDGVLTADPRIVPDARTLPAISYSEATELAYFGAKVIHPKTMHPAVEGDIPIWIKNTFRPEAPGTRIGPDSDNGSVAKAIASISGLAAITVEGRGLLGVSDITTRVFAAVGRTAANVYMISQASSQHSLTFIVQGTWADVVLDTLQAEFETDLARGRVLSIVADRDVAIIAVVGGGMRGTPGVAGRVFGTMGAEGVNVVAIAQGSSELNISFVIADREVSRAVQALHAAFVLAS
ncbi:MAG TPA: aspartate kinase [Thermomicrobiales bacterium]|nr:aspartate kinase [Thermomicrobiales bacterium]